MEVIYQNGGALIRGLNCFDPAQTFDCGQCFRFRPAPDNSFRGVVSGKVVTLKQMEDGFFLYPCDRESFETFWKHYFDLDRDYDAVRNCIAGAPLVAPAMECGKGIRILNQPPFETLITFIISAQNNGKRIALIVENLCRRFGEQVGDGLYAFPAPQALSKASEEELKELGAGYRAKYIVEAAKIAVCEDWESLKSMAYEDAKTHLLRYPGVGEKVANCVLLFSLGFFHAFPVDVWIRRILEKHLQRPIKDGEGEKIGWAWYGESGGLAQQYLFYEARNTHKKAKKHCK